MTVWKVCLRLLAVHRPVLLPVTELMSVVCTCLLGSGYAPVRHLMFRQPVAPPANQDVLQERRQEVPIPRNVRPGCRHVVSSRVRDCAPAVGSKQLRQGLAFPDRHLHTNPWTFKTTWQKRSVNTSVILHADHVYQDRSRVLQHVQSYAYRWPQTICQSSAQ